MTGTITCAVEWPAPKWSEKQKGVFCYCAPYNCHESLVYTGEEADTFKLLPQEIQEAARQIWADHQKLEPLTDEELGQIYADSWDARQDVGPQSGYRHDYALRAVVTAHDARMAEINGWQPIEALPNDKSWVLLWDVNENSPFACTASGMAQEVVDGCWTHWRPFTPPEVTK